MSPVRGSDGACCDGQQQCPTCYGAGWLPNPQPFATTPTVPCPTCLEADREEPHMSHEDDLRAVITLARTYGARTAEEIATVARVESSVDLLAVTFEYLRETLEEVATALGVEIEADYGPKPNDILRADVLARLAPKTVFGAERHAPSDAEMTETMARIKEAERG